MLFASELYAVHTPQASLVVMNMNSIRPPCLPCQECDFLRSGVRRRAHTFACPFNHVGTMTCCRDFRASLSTGFEKGRASSPTSPATREQFTVRYAPNRRRVNSSRWIQQTPRTRHRALAGPIELRRPHLSNQSRLQTVGRTPTFCETKSYTTSCSSI